MTWLIAALMILASAAAIALPLLRPPAAVGERSDLSAELHEREKNAALLAIREADFDQAMGKLSEEDYTSLRRIYEQRALGAMDALAKTAEASVEPVAAAPSGKGSLAAFCVRCGLAFSDQDKFCSGCGSGRPRVVRPA